MFTLFSGLTLALIIHENVVYLKVNEIVLTRSKWLFTFRIDLKPYKNFLNRLSEDLEKAIINTYSIEQFYDFPSKQDYGRIIKELKGKIVALLNDQHTLMENYIELHAIQTKMKRSLIPIIGKSLIYLFGITTESHVKTLLSSASKLPKSQEEIAHVVDENVSVINITRVKMSENRHTLNKIIGRLAHWDVKLGNITETLEK